MLMPKSLTAIMLDKIEGSSNEQLAAMPRDKYGNVTLDSYRAPDGTEVFSLWNEVEGFRVALDHEDRKYLEARIANLLPEQWEKRITPQVH
jgi:hypothetical protein